MGVSTRSWVTAALGERVVSGERLTGGMSTELVCLILESERRVVLRRFTGPRWETAGPRAAANESLVLTILERTAVPAPRLLAVDATGEGGGAPAVLMEFMPGRRTLRPDVKRLAAALAGAMATIHDVGASAIAELPDETAAILQGLDTEAPSAPLDVVPERRPLAPRDEQPASLWRVVHGQRPPLPAASSHLIHNDFSASNVLFLDGRLAAVLDWEDATRGHPAYDVAFCRLSTALTLGLEAGDLVLAAYEAEVGARLEHLAWWDLVAAARLEPDITTWTASANYLGSPALPAPEVVRRFDRFVQIARAGG